MTAVPGALAGIRVLDLTHMLAGPYATMLLADLGAEVIKVEPLHGEGTRRWLEGDPVLSIEGMGAYFLSLNRNKRSLALDLKHPDGHAIFLDLVREADVVISNFGVGVAQRLGVDYPRLREANTRIISCAISGYGSEGPDPLRPAFDLVAQATGGSMSLTGSDVAHPVRAGIPIADLGAGLFAALGVQAALLERARSGEGQHVDISMLDGQVSLLSYMAAMYFMSGESPAAMGNQHWVHVPYNAYATADGHIVITVVSDALWARLKQVLQCPALDRAAFDSQFGRAAARETINRELARILRGNTSAYWLNALREQRIPCASVNSVAEALDDPQVRFRNMVVELQHPSGQSTLGAGNPVKLSRTPGECFAPAPLVGQDTENVLAEWLEYTPKQIELLREQGVIAVPREGCDAP